MATRSPAATIEQIESLAILGAAGYLIYWIGSGKAAAFLGPGLLNLFPKQTSVAPSLATPLQADGTGGAFTSTGKPGTGTLVLVDRSGRPEEWGPHAMVPGLDQQSVQDLRDLGYSDDEIAGMIRSHENDPVALGPAGGAGGSW